MEDGPQNKNVIDKKLNMFRGKSFSEASRIEYECIFNLLKVIDSV